MGDPPVTSRWTIAFLVGMTAGVIATLAALSWMTLARPVDVWSPEQAAEFKAANDAVHAALSRDGGGRSSGDTEADPRYLAAAKTRLARISSELEYARGARDRWGKWGAASGLALTIACGLGYLASREQ